MTIDIQSLTEQRPHLKSPLELYAKWLCFHHEASKLLPGERSAMTPDFSKTYPRECAGSVFRLFVSILELHPEEFEPLRRALESGEIDFMRLPLGEAPALSLPFAEEELKELLFLLSRPYFMALRQAFLADGSKWGENGRCPVCSAQAALASIVEGPQRQLHCAFCGNSGQYRFIGCPNCGSTDTLQFNTILSEDEPGFRVVTCDGCRTYVKVVESQVLDEMTTDLADMASLPLDIVAQSKGYARTAPNPIGLKKIG
jgi:FdhE protein